MKQLRNYTLPGVVVKDIAFGAKGWGSIPEPVKSDTELPMTRHRCDLFSKLLSRRKAAEMSLTSRYTLALS